MAHKLRVLILAPLLALAACADDPPMNQGDSPLDSPTPAATTTQPSISVEDIERANRRRQRRERPTPTPTVNQGDSPLDSPAVVRRFIPFDAKRKADMAAYAMRHYGLDTFRLQNPQVIVEHFTATATAQEAIDIFAPNQPDSELGELPGTCAHFLIDTDGTVLQLVPVSIMCRHTVGLNYTAIGIEHVGSSDAQVLGNRAQMKASLALTRSLMERFGIARSNVIGHNENRESPFHREAVPELRDQTHQDFTRASMDEYRARVASTP